MLMPKRVKRRKQFRGSMKGKALRGNKITNGEYGLVAMEPCWIRSNQIEAARIAMTRYIKRGGKVWIREDLDPNLTTTFDVTCHSDTGSFNLVRSDPTWFHCYKTIFTVRDLVSS